MKKGLRPLDENPSHSSIIKARVYPGLAPWRPAWCHDARPAVAERGAGATRRRRGGRKGALFFLLCCRCCQALVRMFSFPAGFGRCVTWPRLVWRLPVALGPLVANALLSVRTFTSVTRCSLRLSTSAGRPVGGDPISPTAALHGPECNGPPPPAPRPTPDCAPSSRLRLFEHGPRRECPGLYESPQRNA